MKSIIKFFVKAFGPDSGYPTLSGIGMAIVLFAVGYTGAWFLAWTAHFAGEFIHWLPWPKDFS